LTDDEVSILTRIRFHKRYSANFNEPENSEGLDKALSLLYYSRMRFITQLLPLLTASPLPGRVVSVFAPTRDKGGKFVLDDLSLVRNYGFGTLGPHAAYMTTLFFEKLADRNAGKLSLSHYFPGLVQTPAFQGTDVPAWLRCIFSLLSPLLRLFIMVPAKESGARVIFHASPRFPERASNREGKRPAKVDDIHIATSSDGVLGGGAYRTNWNNELVPVGKNYPKLRKDGVSELVWDHTQKVFQDIVEKGCFKG
jgi:hypothetical protein